ncbi:MAG: hypothetical protein RSE22_07655, partial [Mucinivorans sp.]
KLAATALLGATRPNPAGAQRLLIAGSNKKSPCRGSDQSKDAVRPVSPRATAPTPRAVPRHGNLLVTFCVNLFPNFHIFAP